MQFSLKNNGLHLIIDHPNNHYRGSRFDWTGKITNLRFEGISLLSRENPEELDEHLHGRGLYNEFGIDSPLGFEEAQVGEWFHKIGIGLLRKVNPTYDFNETYQIKPAVFSVQNERDKLVIRCTSETVNGFAYRLKKEIGLFENTFSIKYKLENTGEKEILTNEYNHNFIGLNQTRLGRNILLKFPFQMQRSEFQEIVNPGNKVNVHESELKFNANPEEPFFFSNLSGNQPVDARWELQDLISKIGIREVGSFQAQSINVWGSKHVISPELFIKIQILPGQTAEWSRTYEVFKW